MNMKEMKDFLATPNHAYYPLVLEQDEENQSWNNVLRESLTSLKQVTKLPSLQWGRDLLCLLWNPGCQQDSLGRPYGKGQNGKHNKESNFKAPQTTIYTRQHHPNTFFFSARKKERKNCILNDIWGQCNSCLAMSSMTDIQTTEVGTEVLQNMKYFVKYL